MEYLINRGISVYILHDCDLFGYNIHERIAEGSDTYPMPLQVTDIGLKVDDVKNKLPERTLLTVISQRRSNSLRRTRRGSLCRIPM